MDIVDPCTKIAELYEQIKQGGGTDAQKRHTDRGKRLPRARITLLLDPGSPFLEIAPFAAYQVYEDDVPAAGVIAGIGLIHNKPVMVVANDATVKGGTYYPLTVKKHLRAQEIAAKTQIPCVYLVDSGGANLPHQAEVFPDRDHFGRIFYNQATMSAAGLPQIAVVMGSCTAGGAYVPAMADECIMVQDQATIFLGGPPLVKAATGEIVTAEELGGAALHCKTSGVADHLAENDDDALVKARRVMQHTGQRFLAVTSRPYLDPPFEPRAIYNLLPKDPANKEERLDAHLLIKHLVDLDSFDEFKSLYAPTLVCGFASICGFEVGIVANNGILYGESALKGTHFIELCCARKIPLLFLQNIVGFMVGKKFEAEGIAKHGAKMVHAVSCAKVPKLTVIVGASFGAGNYGMCGRAYDPDFLWMWPNAQIGVMGGEQAASVMLSVTQAKRIRDKNPMTLEEEKTLVDTLRSKYRDEHSALYASARLWDDGIILPHETRRMIGMALSILTLRPSTPSPFGILRM